MKFFTASLCTGIVFALLSISSSALADGCDGAADGVEDAYSMELTCADPGASGEFAIPSGGGASAGAGEEPAYIDYRWHSPCTGFSATQSTNSTLDCGVARACPTPGERSWQLWGLSSQSRAWEFITSQCYGRTPTVADAPEPTVTPAMVLNAIRQIGLPSLDAVTQPTDKTLVNFETIFYAEPEPFARTVTLLDQSVDIAATASQYTWHHGDGTTVTTSSPGAPYPSKEITHNYLDAHVTVAPSVDVTYTARFRVDGDGWQDIDETVTIDGPATDLRVSEATAVLSGEYE